MERLYNVVKSWYDDGIITTENWQEFCVICLEELMTKNEKVLDRLKNMQYNKYVNKRKKDFENAIIYLVCCYECYQCCYPNR